MFFIPFFGLDKYWVLEKNNNEYEIPHDEQLRLSSLLNKKGFLWYNYIGIYLLVFGYMFFSLISSYETTQKKYNVLIEETQFSKKLKNSIIHPKVGTRYVFQLLGDESKIFEVHNFSKDSIQLLIPLEYFDSTINESFNVKMKSSMNEKIYIEEELTKLRLIKNIDELEYEKYILKSKYRNVKLEELMTFVWISKESLLNLVLHKNSLKKRVVIPELKNYYPSFIEISEYK